MLSDIHRSGWGRDKISWRRPPRNFERRKNPANVLVAHARPDVKFSRIPSDFGRKMRPFGRSLEPCMAQSTATGCEHLGLPLCTSGCGPLGKSKAGH